MKLEFVPRGLSKKDAVVVIRELRAIEQSNGLITPRAVVAKAKAKGSPLHPFFEWDNNKAAELYRVSQARQLICSVYVRDADSESPESVRAFVNIKAQDEESDKARQGYVEMRTAMANPSMQAQVLEYGKNQLVLWRLKFGHLQQFLGVVNEIEKVAPPAASKSKAA